MAISPLRRLLQLTEEKVLEYENHENPSTYAEAIGAIRDLQLQVEKPGDYANRFRFQILENIAFVMLAHLGIVQAIVSRKGRLITAAQLAKEYRCDETMIIRLMRVLTAIGVFEEAHISTYRSTPRSEILASRGQAAGMQYLLTLHGRMGGNICKYLDSNHTSHDQSALAFASEGRTLWQLFDEEPSLRKLFNDYMDSARRGADIQTWHLRYPPCIELTQQALRSREESVLMVDVGGGAGGQVGSFRKQFPDIPGKCILQDLPETIRKNPAPEGVEAMSYNFFTTQPVPGAQIYLFRSVCHDWPDEDCRRILGNTVAAMDPQRSRLLLDEWVLPETNVSLQAATLDVNMMLTFQAMERTESQWRALLESVDLQIVKIWQTEGAGESIIETKCKQ